MALLGIATGTTNLSGDHDWFKLDLKANTLYTLAGSSRLFFALHDANGNLIRNSDAYGPSFNSGGGVASGIAFMPVTSGSYFLDVILRFAQVQGPYYIQLADVDDDYRSNVTTIGIVAVGGTVSGTVNAIGDHDWFKVALDANTLYAISAVGNSVPKLRMVDANGTEVPSLDNVIGFDSRGGFGFPSAPAIGFMTETSGNFFIDVTGFGPVGGYTVTVVTSPDDYRNNTTTTGELAVGGTVTGVNNVVGDHDWFKVNLQANTLYVLSASSETPLALVEPPLSLVVRDADGQPVAAPDAYGRGALSGIGAVSTGFMPSVDGTYFIDIGGGTGKARSYSLSATVSPDDFRNNTTTTGAVSVGGATAVVLNAPGEHDWLRVNLTANTLYSIRASDMFPGSIPGSFFGQLTMFDAAGNRISASDGNTMNGVLAFTPATSGEYFVDFLNMSRSPNYSVAVASSPDDFPSNVSTSGTVTPGGSVAGVFNVAGDHDWFRVNLTANTPYSITSTSRISFGVSVLNANGTLASGLDASGSTGQIVFMPASTDVYYIAVASGSIGSYTLNVSVVGDDHRNNVSATGTFVGAPIGLVTTANNDILSGTPGNELIDGLAGTDTVRYSGNRADYTLERFDNVYVLTDNSGRDGTDTLLNIERIKFADLGIALDVGLTQSAGKAQLLLGAVLGKDLLAQKKPLLGTVIDLFDQGFTMQQFSGAIMRLDIWGVLANGGNATASNTQIANYLMTTVIKTAPFAGTLAAAVAALNTETGPEQGNFLAQLAQSFDNQVQVGLVGLANTTLATTGLEFGI